jgi:hypothetical protein
MPNASPLETTTYTVYVTSSEGDVICVDEVTVFVNQIEIQNGTIPEICAGEMVTISVNPSGKARFLIIGKLEKILPLLTYHLSLESHILLLSRMNPPVVVK